VDQGLALSGLSRVRRDVRYGSKADIAPVKCDVRFTPKSGHCRTTLGCPLCAKSRHTPPYICNLIPENARSERGIVRESRISLLEFAPASIKRTKQRKTVKIERLP
jgi:hypothetical protein